MTDPFLEQKIQNWAAEFAESDAVRGYPASLREYAAQIASVFLQQACATRGVTPDALTETDLKSGLFEGAGRLALSAEAQARVPEFCAAFLEQLRGQGRVSLPKTHTAFVRALREPYGARASTGDSCGASAPRPKQKPFKRPVSKLSPNDPCPCGSGKKYKKCCQRLLG